MQRALFHATFAHVSLPFHGCGEHVSYFWRSRHAGMGLVRHGYGTAIKAYKTLTVKTSFIMAILYDWYKTPQPQASQGEDVKVHPRIHFNGSVDTRQISEMIQQSCSLTKADVAAALAALSEIMGRELADGKLVHLCGLGYFYPTLTTTQPVRAADKGKGSKVVLKSIRFVADKQLKTEVGGVQAKCWNCNPNTETAKAVDVNSFVARHFEGSQYILRRDLQQMLGMSRTTACRHIKRLLAEGGLRRAGNPRQGVYVQGGEMVSARV